MTRLILPSLAVGAAALGLAACGGGSSNSTANTSRPDAGIVSVKKVSGSDVLTSSAGKTLYNTTTEKGGRIRCMGSCLEFWHPVVGSQAQAMKASTSLSATLGTLKRPDGRTQLTFKGLPVYTFAEEGAGKLSGDNFKDAFQGTHFTWRAARTSGSATSSGTSTTSRGNGYGY